MTAAVRWRPVDALTLLIAGGAVFALAKWAGGRLDYRWDWAAAAGFVLHRDADGAWQAGVILDGFAMTLRLTVYGALIAGALGVALGVMRASRFAAARALSGCYVEMVRNTPPIVFMLVFYFFISAQIMPHLGVDALAAWAGDSGVWAWLLGDSRVLENFLSGLLCLAMFEAAFCGGDCARGDFVGGGESARSGGFFGDAPDFGDAPGDTAAGAAAGRASAGGAAGGAGEGFGGDFGDFGAGADFCGLGGGQFHRADF